MPSGALMALAAILRAEGETLRFRAGDAVHDGAHDADDDAREECRPEIRDHETHVEQPVGDAGCKVEDDGVDDEVEDAEREDGEG